MCGIIGYSGNDNAKDIILSALQSLEYRGYDSAGLTVFTNDGLKTLKTCGRVSDLKNKTNAEKLPVSHCGIGHTRWATHGKPTWKNAHPHGSDTLMLVHNGIIENYKELKTELLSDGTQFYSQTDTEIIAKIIEKKYNKFSDPIKAIISTVKILNGSFALGIVFNNEKDTVYAVKKDSPLLIGIDKKGNFIASDISAFLKYTKKYILLEDGEIAKITKDKVTVYSLSGKEIIKPIEIAQWNTQDTEKAEFPHFMLKEISEEPTVLNKTINNLTNDNLPNFDEYITEKDFFDNINKITIIACGTAMHSGLLGKYYIEKYARIPVSVEIASEFRYSQPILNKNDLVIIISQSGETADSLAALRLVNKNNIRTLAIVNTIGSGIAREANHVIYTQAGPEIAVASTKAFSTQVSVLILLALKLSENTIDSETIKNKIKALKHCINDSIKSVISNTDKIISASKVLEKHKNVFFIGRGFDNYLSQEASLKLKEISYINSQAYPAGELKHGTISLIEEGTPVIALATDNYTIEKIYSNIEEVKSRGAMIISVCGENEKTIKDISDIAITIPNDDNFTRPITCATVIQLLAYHTALNLGRDIDKPRNLAKSVTVE